jgi:type III secretion system YscQ/HrcQ family protein
MLMADPKLEPGALEEDDAAASPEHISDPFAGDLFASSRPPTPAAGEAGRAAADAPPAYDPNWHARLPRLSSAQARLSSALTNLIPTFSAPVGQGVRGLLARYLRVGEEAVSVSSLGLREREFDGGRESESGPRVWTTLSVAPDYERIAVSIDTDFAAALVERALGGEGAGPETARELSSTEQAVVEFLWLSLLRELNAQAGEALWRLETQQTRPPAWLDGTAGEGAGAATRLIVTSARVEAGPLVGLVNFYLTRAALDALDDARNPLMRHATRHGAARLERLRGLAPDVSLRPVVGETEVSAAALAQLETGDIVIVARPAARLDAGAELYGQLGARLGDGREAVLTGELLTGAADGVLSLIVETIRRGGRAPAAERLRMTEETTKEAGDEGAVALEELWLTLSVELAARRVSIEELSRLRVGQLLELGCRATDPVELLVDGRTVARGELVDIEGQLGVRVTQLTG